LRGWTVRVY